MFLNEFLREYFSKVYINGPRYDVLASMCYQLGTYGFSKFKNMILAIHSEDWNKAADEALDSRWAKQTPNRAKRHSEVLRSGTLKVYSGYLN